MISTEGWKNYRLGDCVNFLSVGTPSKKNPKYWDGDIPWVSCKENLMKSWGLLTKQHMAQKGYRQIDYKIFHCIYHLSPIQRKIAAILSAYDDLIENNTRRIEILEEMARNLYREWFVNFRFPGHEQVKIVDSELGLIYLI